MEFSDINQLTSLFGQKESQPQLVDNNLVESYALKFAHGVRGNSPEDYAYDAYDSGHGSFLDSDEEDNI